MNRNFRLEDLIREALARPVRWGEDDCILFAADACLLQTGIDPIPRLRDAWSSKREAYEVIVTHGGDLITTMTNLAREFGHSEIDPAAAHNGDLGVFVEKDIPTAACRIEQGWLARAERGIAVRPTALKAWRTSL